MIYVGIDVAKDKHECIIITEENKIVTPCFSFPNTREGFQRLDREIRSASQGDYEKVKIGLEATGHYSFNLLSYLVRQNWNVVQLNPLSVANFKKAQSLRRTKTDKNDVRYIAEMMLSDISAEDVQEEIDNIKGVRQKEKLLTVQCFGCFDVYAKDETLSFKRSKTKELFAFLVDRKGAGMTAKQICTVLFPDDTNDEKNVAYVRQLILDLKNALKTVGAESVLCHETPYYRINTDLLKCDYISHLETGKPEFHGEYMTQYSWAEETCASLGVTNQ